MEDEGIIKNELCRSSEKPGKLSLNLFCLERMENVCVCICVHVYICVFICVLSWTHNTDNIDKLHQFV